MSDSKQSNDPLSLVLTDLHTKIQAHIMASTVLIMKAIQSPDQYESENWAVKIAVSHIKLSGVLENMFKEAMKDKCDKDWLKQHLSTLFKEQADDKD